MMRETVKLSHHANESNSGIRSLINTNPVNPVDTYTLIRTELREREGSLVGSDNNECGSLVE